MFLQQLSYQSESRKHAGLLHGGLASFWVEPLCCLLVNINEPKTQISHLSVTLKLNACLFSYFLLHQQDQLRHWTQSHDQHSSSKKKKSRILFWCIWRHAALCCPGGGLKPCGVSRHVRFWGPDRRVLLPPALTGTDSANKYGAESSRVISPVGSAHN